MLSHATENFPQDQRPDDQISPFKVATSMLVSRLEREADDRVMRRNLVEKRWIADLEQYHGEYDQTIEKKLEANDKSSLFINQTRPKTNACAARLSDMLFPTDDNNWGIKPTPVPELSRGAQEAADAAMGAAKQANQALQQGDPAQAEAIANAGNQMADVSAKMKADMDAAQKACQSMQDEIEDQLRECNYAIQARDVIDDTCKIGTGVMKGPVASMDRARRSWEQGEQGYAITYKENPRPAYYRVDPWSFFPDPDARTVDESESFFERHLMRAKDLRRLAKQPGFSADAIRSVLKQNPSRNLPSYLADLRNITGENQAPTDKMFQVWEYRGPITSEELIAIAQNLGREDLAETYAEPDPLMEIQVVIWFCQGELLKFGVHHLDSGESIYSVYNLEKDDSSIWGYGIPSLMRDSQKALNAAWRMMMDNAALSSGPQIVINSQHIDPADKKWNLAPRKVWIKKPNAPAGQPVFETYEVSMHQAELANIIMLAKQFIDDETSISTLAQGEQGAHTTQTAQGMAILMNAVNVVFRRFVKNFDDDITVPNIRRLYDWNMQFSQKDYIKGDMEVDARGTSVLLVRELQAQNLMVLANMTAHPILGLLLKAAPVVRKLSQSMMIPPDEIVKTDEELKQEAAMAARQGEKPDPEVMKLQLQKEIAEKENETRIAVANMQRETELVKLAQTSNMDLEKLRAMIMDKREERGSKERMFAAEAAIEASKPKEEPGEGSGGYFSQ